MKKLKVKDQSKCYSCFHCMVACSEAFYKEFDEEKSCIRIANRKDGRLWVKTCTQCGNCAKVCEQGAITQNAKGVYMISRKLCNNCGKCVEACPFGLIVKVEGRPAPSKCTACGICVKKCPMEILEIVES